MNAAIDYNNLGIAYLKVGFFQRATAMFKRAIELVMAISTESDSEPQEVQENSTRRGFLVELEIAKETCERYPEEHRRNNGDSRAARLNSASNEQPPSSSSDNMLSSPYSVFVYQQPFNIKRNTNNGVTAHRAQMDVNSVVTLYNIALVFHLRHMARGAQWTSELHTKSAHLYHFTLAFISSPNTVTTTSDLAMMVGIQTCCYNNLGALSHEEGDYKKSKEHVGKAMELITNPLYDSSEFIDANFVAFVILNSSFLKEPTIALAA